MINIMLLEEFIDAKIDLRTLPIRPNLDQEQVENRVIEAREKLKKNMEEVKNGEEENKL